MAGTIAARNDDDDDDIYDFDVGQVTDIFAKLANNNGGANP